MDRRLCVHLCCLLSACALAAVSGAPIQSAPVTGKFWHISDLHLDATYHVSEDHSQVCLSSKGHEALNPGEFGDYMCDSPYELILSAFDFMKRSGQLTDFIIWTGDSPPHFLVEKLSTDIVVQILSNMTSTIRKYFPELMVYPALGNHDYWPQDQFPNSTNKIYQAAADLWEPWLKTEAIKTLRAGGFYSQLVQPGLRVVSLNTNLYYSPNKVTTNMTDPAGQFRWLMETLESSRQNAEKVYIIAHVPIGYLPQCNSTTAMREVHNERLVQIFRKYGDVIAGQFYGHTHRDSVMVLLDDQGSVARSLNDQFHWAGNKAKLGDSSSDCDFLLDAPFCFLALKENLLVPCSSHRPSLRSRTQVNLTPTTRESACTSTTPGALACWYTFVDILRAILLSLESMIEDPELQVNGFVLIIDWSNFTFKQASKLTPSMLRLAIEGLQDSFPARFGGIHFVNQPWYIHALYTVIRPFLKDKTRKRVRGTMASCVFSPVSSGYLFFFDVQPSHLLTNSIMDINIFICLCQVV
uniref:Sphingomyelin phosphodiesterase acid like 3A n=1 Tax=Scleropages formosus TaxID=113540 RepID=A0A8C9TG75_SCLFO